VAPPLGPVLGELQRAAALLEDLGVGWALVGGLAVGVHADPRFTRDVDLAIAVVNDREAEGLILRCEILATRFRWRCNTSQPDGSRRCG
jgi:hypothetical protein